MKTLRYREIPVGHEFYKNDHPGIIADVRLNDGSEHGGAVIVWGKEPCEEIADLFRVLDIPCEGLEP